MRRLVLSLVLLQPVVLARGQAPGPLVTDRPDFTESTPVVPRGRFQLEGGSTGERANGHAAWSVGEALLRAALGRRVEARFTLGGSVDDARRRVNDASVGVKVALRERSPAVSVIADAGVPFVEAGRGTFGVKLLGSVDVTERVGLGVNLNAARVREDGALFGELSASASLASGLTERVGAFVEGYAFLPVTGPDEARVPTPFANAGLTFQPTPDVQLDARVGYGHGRTVFAGVGAAVRF